MNFLSLLLIFFLSNEILVNAKDSDGTKDITSLNTSRTKLKPLPIIPYIFGCYRPKEFDDSDIKRSTRPGPKDVKEKYDAREEYQGCYTIRQTTIQGWCASCWAIAVANTFSDRICIASKGQKNYSMSFQQLLACSEENNGCKGGNIYRAWEFLENFPLVTGGPYLSEGDRKDRSKYSGPYGVNDGCQPYLIPPAFSLDFFRKQKCSREECPITHKAKEVIVLPKDEFEIRREIQNYGPVSAMIAVYPSFYSYKNGIYRKKKGEKLSMHHAVRIIGWGKMEKTEEESELKYWIVANTLFDDSPWGDDGFFKILRGSDECRIESFVVSGLPVLDEKTPISN